MDERCVCVIDSHGVLATWCQLSWTSVVILW